MAHTTAEQGRPSILASLRGLVAGWRGALERHRVFRQTFDELSMLSDRDLADLGIDRSQIVGISWDAAERA